MRRLLAVLACWFMLGGLAGAQSSIEMTRIAHMGMGGYLDPGYPVVACRGNLVLWSRDNALEIYDATDPDAQVLKRRTLFASRIKEMRFIRDGLCWVRADKTYLVELADPAHPLVYATAKPMLFNDIASSGALVAYIEPGDNWTPAKLVMMDVSVTSQARELGRMDIADYANNHICFIGQRVILANGSDKIHVADISDPTHPRDLFLLKVGDDHTHSINDVESFGNRVYFAAGARGGVYVYEYTAPSSMALKYIWRDPGAPGLSYDDTVYQMAVDGNLACLIRPDSKIQVVRLDDPSTITVTGSMTLPSIDTGYSNVYDRRLGFNRKTAFVPSSSDGVMEVDVRDPKAPRLRPTGYCPGAAAGVAAVGNTVLVCNGTLMTLNLTDRGQLVPVRLLPFDSGSEPSFYDQSFSDMEIRGNLAYCIGRSGMSVLDVTNPNEPAMLGKKPFSFGDSKISLGGHHAVLSKSESRSGGPLHLVDISNPGDPVYAGSYASHTLFGRFEGAVISGEYVYANDYGWGLCIAESGSLKPRGTLQMQSFGGIAVRYPYVYIPASGGLTVCNVSDPDAPKVSGVYALNEATDLCLRGRYLFVGGGTLAVYDIAVPDKPRLCGTYGTLGGAKDIFVDDTCIYLAAGECGLEIVRWKVKEATAGNWERYE
ncbi:hypothetical protein LLG95_18790 [bacterium]|nr:hypothetical protein [bacterium]